jgi:hypothetical protein
MGMEATPGGRALQMLLLAVSGGLRGRPLAATLPEELTREPSERAVFRCWLGADAHL